MNATREEMKRKALEIMKRLDIYQPYIDGFREENAVCFFENFGGYWAYQEPELMKKVQEIENRYHCLVYAITHEYTELGEMYDFLIMSPYKNEWDSMIYSNGKKHIVFAYVWNKDNEWESELGNVTVRSFGGGIRRII